MKQKKCQHTFGTGSRAFTTTELLIVIGIIAALIAVAVPALRGVQQRSRKMVESSNIRQVHQAWLVYGNFNRDAALPGYLDHNSGPATQNVQEAWRVQYEYPIAPDPVAAPSDRAIPHEIAAPWTWRLGQYFDYSLDTIWRYRSVSNNLATLASIAESAGPGDEFPDVDALMLAIAEEPEFAYNAYHIGGWWQMTEAPGSSSGTSFMPMPRFHNAIKLDETTGSPVGPIEVVSRSIPQIRRAGEVIVFATATRYDTAGEQPYRSDRQPGTHVVTPPHLADVQRWSVYTDPNGVVIPDRLETFNVNASDPVYAPFGRYNRTVTVIHADGSIETTMPMNLDTPTRWIDAAVQSQQLGDFFLFEEN